MAARIRIGNIEGAIVLGTIALDLAEPVDDIPVAFTTLFPDPEISAMPDGSIHR